MTSRARHRHRCGMPLGPLLAGALVALLLAGCALGPTPGGPVGGSGGGVDATGSSEAAGAATGAAATPTAGATGSGGSGGSGGASGSATTGTATTGAPGPAEAGAAPSAELAAAWARLRPTLAATQVGVAILPVGAAPGAPPVLLGEWRTGAAWSTSKVPLTVAALAAADPSRRAEREMLARAAITVSDNAAAEQLWSKLGGGTAAAAAVDAVLAGHGDPLTRTQAARVRPAYTPFGQTRWSLAAQARFAAELVCDNAPAAATTVRLMGSISAGDRWGLGRLPGAVFKGGWGPEPDGPYLVRQLGVVSVSGNRVAVAVAVRPSSGSFAGGTAVLDTLARWLAAQRLPTGPGCPA